MLLLGDIWAAFELPSLAVSCTSGCSGIRLLCDTRRGSTCCDVAIIEGDSDVAPAFAR